MNEGIFLLGLPFHPGCREAQAAAQFSYIGRQLGTTGAALRQFIVPPFKVGTLDSLMECSDDLAKLDPQFEGTVLKLVALMEEASGKSRAEITNVRISSTQEVTTDGYLKHFQWNGAQYDTKESIRALIDRIAQVAVSAEERVRGLLTDYTETRNRLQAASRKGQGSWAVRPMREVVSEWSRTTGQQPLNTEFLVTLFVAVPVAMKRDWAEGYWLLNEFVCPGSAAVLAEDKEFSLNSVVVFKKVADDFKLACRKRKFVVRDLSTEDDLSAVEFRELQVKADKEKNALLALLAQQYSQCYVAWIHVKTLRLFVECMLKYGLPPRFVGVIIVVDEKKEHDIRKRLSQVFPDLKTPLADEHVHDTGALQHEYPYVSIRVTNVVRPH